MPIIHIEGFWNLPVNPARRVPGFMEKRKADNKHSNPLFYCPSPLNSQHLHFQFTVASLLKIFLRSRRDWEKKCREGSRHWLCNHIAKQPSEIQPSYHLEIQTSILQPPNFPNIHQLNYPIEQFNHPKLNYSKTLVIANLLPLSTKHFRVLLLLCNHKVLIYIEHHSVCPLVGIGTPPPL